MTRRLAIQLAILAALLGLAAFWSYGLMADSRARAESAATATADCARMVAKIEAAAARPERASDHERLAAETTGIIERAAKAAGITPNRLVRISPHPPQRLGESIYKEKPTQVELKNVSLKQLVVLMHGLIGAGDGLNVRSIRLRAPRHDETSDIWNAELIVTYLIYAPPE